MSISDFEDNGFFITRPLLGDAQLRVLSKDVGAASSNLASNKVGHRHLLVQAWCSELSITLRRHPLLASVLPPTCVAVQCTFFEKSPESNWLVALHQDLSIPVAERIEHDALSAWSEKEGCWFVQPPTEVLQQLIAVRFHVDVCNSIDGALKVVPGSHRHGRVDLTSAQALREESGELSCAVDRGGALVMRPLLLHSSSKASGQSRRRVLHFLFGPAILPYGLQWHHAV
jgi:hypothetical protein